MYVFVWDLRFLAKCILVAAGMDAALAALYRHPRLFAAATWLCLLSIAALLVIVLLAFESSMLMNFDSLSNRILSAIFRLFGVSR